MKLQLVTALFAFACAGTAFGADSKLNVDAAKSSVQWTGSKVVGGAHTGKVKVKSGGVTLDAGKVKGGEVIVDMTSIVNEDLTDATWNKKLVDHLRSPDFFDVTKHETAKLTIDGIESQKGNEYKLKGTLTIKGISKPVTFTAVEREEKGGKAVKAELAFDRTDFGVKYNSGKFFQGLGDKVINDEVKLTVDVVLSAAAAKT